MSAIVSRVSPYMDKSLSRYDAPFSMGFPALCFEGSGFRGLGRRGWVSGFRASGFVMQGSEVRILGFQALQFPVNFGKLWVFGLWCPARGLRV